MATPRFKGASDRFKPKDQRVDTRDIITKIHVALQTSEGSMYFAITITIVVFVSFFFPLLLIIATPIAILITRKYLIPQLRYINMPYRVPKHANMPDGSFDGVARKVNLRKNPEKAYGQGVYYYGIDRQNHQQIWKSDSDERVHDLLIGTTGAGKTETIKMVLTNPLLQNSGFILSDAKGTTELVAELMYLLTRFMRQDDYLVTNFITAGRDLLVRQEDKMTNTFNLMSYTSAAMLSEQLVYLLADSEGSGGDMWKDRTITYLTATTHLLTFLRDRGLLLLEPKTYVEYQELNQLIRAAYGEDFDDNYKNFGEIYITAVSPLRAYLKSLAGFDEGKLYKQPEKCVEQHGYVIMQFTRAISDLSFNFGHIYGTKSGEIDMFDVVLNRRCLINVLPALQNAPPTIRMLGKLFVGSIKQMMAGALGNRIDGMVRNVIEAKITASATCFKIVLDELAYQIVKGLSVIPAQARGLTFSLTFSAQELKDIFVADEAEGEAIVANTGTKTFGRINSGTEGLSMQRLRSLVDQVTQSVVNGYNIASSAMGINYQSSTNVNIEKQDRISYQDIASQQEGQFTIVVAKKIDGGKEGGVFAIHAQTMFVQPPKLAKIRLNDFVSIEKELTYFDSKKYDNELKNFAYQLAENKILQSCPNYKKHAIGALNQVDTHLESISKMAKLYETDVKSGFFAIMRTMQNMLDSVQISGFSAPFYEVVDSTFANEIDGALDSIFTEIKLDTEEVDVVLNKTIDHIQDERSQDLLTKTSETIIDEIVDQYLNLDSSEIETIEAVNAYIEALPNVYDDQLYSEEFATTVREHLKQHDIYIQSLDIPSFEDLLELDQCAAEAQKSIFSDDFEEDDLFSDAQERYNYVTDFIKCKNLVFEEKEKEIESEDQEILSKLEKYHEIVYRMISAKLKDK
ncbi:MULTISPECIES: type IV secretory system conjugative DNA transfer family protein [Acinetobacter calcoaceticus/baumannii complex]|nr:MULTISPECIES: type IV secretory system conjugative DNA transfer family protein [Acinetobacter calcoaceticus/baumannii complex]MCQ8901649.1 type IV secretory system conjugative DNA transfer family protein [Acinetobacter baumannii]MDI9255360.1 type IV secretory system conjugative DNA transfer family protein [Acinetobacter baumannii]UZG64481.1 TrbC [Acinetobacter baumannii]